MDHHDAEELERTAISTLRLVICVLLVLSGITLGMISMLLISNKYGNTDAVGLTLLGFAGWSTATGIAYVFKRFSLAVFIGAIAAPLTVVAMVVLFWSMLIVYVSV